MRSIIKRQFIFVLLSTFFIFSSLSAQISTSRAAMPAFKGQNQETGTLVVNNLSATEGADSFAIHLNLGVQNNPSLTNQNYYQNNSQKIFEFDPISIYDFVTVKPETKFTINFTNSGFVLSGVFKPETEYTVTLRQGLKIKRGPEVAADIVKKVKTGSLRPQIRFSSKARYVPGVLSGNLSFESVNVKAIEISVRQVFSQNLHQWLTTGEYANQYVSEEIKKSTIQISSKKNERYKGVISLDEFNPLGHGIYVITATKKSLDSKVTKVNSSFEMNPSNDHINEGEEPTEPDNEDNYNYRSQASDTASVVVSNLSAIVKWGAKNTLKVWTLKTNDLSPTDDVTVDLYSDSNRKLDSCKTEGRFAECSLKWKDLKSANPYVVVLRSQKDATYIKLSDLAIKNDRFHVGNRDYVQDEHGFDAFVFSGRDLYRPGESVDLSVQVRNKKFEAVHKIPLIWKITNPKGKIVREGSTQTDEFGVSHLAFQTQLSFETGKYKAQVWTGNQELHSASFLVEEFVPERIGLQVKSEQEEYINKAEALFKIEALYLFGPPVVSGSYKASCTLVPAFNKIPQHPEYSTGFYMSELNKAINLEVVTGTTNEKGISQFSCPYQNQIGKKLPVVYELRAKTDIEEAGSSRVTSKTATTIVGSTNALVGLKVEDKQNSLLKIQGGFFDFKGGRIKRSTTLKVRLFRMDQNWNYSYNYNGYNNWKVEEIVVPTGIEKTFKVNDSVFEFSLTPPEDWGRWLVRLEDLTTGYTADLNAGYLGWYYDENASGGSSVREPEDLKIEVSKLKLSPGEGFKASFQAPFAGRLLVTLETNTVHESKWVVVEKPGRIEVEFKTPNVLPNFYITGLLLKNPQEGKRFLPARAFGSQSLQVVPADHRMQVHIKAPKLMESRKELKIEISNDQKVETEYTVAVVDEGILQMTNFKSPDPLARFFESRRLGVISSETIGWTMSGVAKGKETPGGDEGKNKNQQNIPVRLVSFFNPLVKSDSSGRAEIKFFIPEFQGKVRIMVVASHKTRMGSADLNVTVRDPLVIQTTLPRFLTQGDKFKFPVALTNTTDKEQKITVSVQTSSEIKVATSQQAQSLAANQMKVLKFPVDVLAASGTADVQIRAQTEDGKISSSESFNLQVRPQGVEQTLHLTYQAGEYADLNKVIPQDWHKDYMKLRATVSNQPFLGSISHLDYLIHYPYGCIEQTTSATLPLLAITDLLKFIDTRAKKTAPIQDMVNKGISRVLSMQTGSGGFGYWPGDSEANLWGTAYATYMLIEAKKLGYEVSAEAIDSALNFMLSYIRAKPFNILNPYASDSISNPWMLYVLAKGGRQVTAELRQAITQAMDKLNQNSASQKASNLQVQLQAKDQQGENLFLLAATAKALGDNESLKKIMPNEDLLISEFIGPRDSYYTYWSSLRSDGLRLTLIDDLWPKHQAQQVLTQRIVHSLGKLGGRYSTQDVAWSVLALGKQARFIDKLQTSELKKMKLFSNGKNVAQGYELDGMPTWTMEGSLGKNILTVSNFSAEKKGAWLYVNITGITQTIPKGKGIFEIERRYLDRLGSEIDSKAIKQGDVLTIHLKFKSKNNIDHRNVAIVDRIPAGFEIENTRLGRGEELSWIDKKTLFEPEYIDIRDDRIQLFGSVNPEKQFYYSVRAVTPGQFIAPAALIELMYEPESIEYGESASVQITDK